MKKIFFAAVVFALALLMSACREAGVQFSIGEDHSVTVAYRITVNKSSDAERADEFEISLEQVKTYWEGRGMVTSTEETHDTVTLLGSRTIQTDSREEAYRALKRLMTDEYSVFSSLEFDYAASDLESDYDFTGTVFLQDIIRKDAGKTIPDDIREVVVNKLSSSLLTVTVTLPGEIRESNADDQTNENGFAKGVWEIRYGEVKEMRLSAHNIHEEEVLRYENLKARDQLYNILFFASIGAGSAALITAAVLIIRKRLMFRRTY